MQKWNGLKKNLNILKRLIEKIGCPVIDVTNKAVEETANIIFNKYQKNKQNKIAHSLQCAIFYCLQDAIVYILHRCIKIN